MMQTCVLWCRVSSDEQAKKGLSLEVQARAVRDYAVREGMTVLREWTSVDESAWGKDPRPRFVEMLRFVQQKKVNHIVAYKFDRIARNTPDFDHAWSTPVGTPERNGLISVTEPVPIGAAGRMTAMMLAVIAEFSSNLSSERIKDVMAARAAQGAHQGRPRPGYRNAKIDGIPSLAPTEHWNHARAIWEDMLTANYTLDDLETRNRLRGGPNWSRTVIGRMLHDVVYRGDVKWGNAISKGKHKPMVTPLEWDQVQRIASGERSPAYTKHDSFWLKGLWVCERCGKPVTAGTVKKKYRRYYCHRCPKPQRWHAEDRAEAALAKEVRLMRVPPVVAKRFLDELRKPDAATKARESSLNSLHQRRSDLHRKRSGLIDMRAEGEIDAEAFRFKKLEFDHDIALVQAEVARLEAAGPVRIEVMKQLFELLEGIDQLWDAANEAEKRRILEIVFLNFSMDGVTLCTKKRKPFDLLTERLSESFGSGGRI